MNNSCSTSKGNTTGWLNLTGSQTIVQRAQTLTLLRRVAWKKYVVLQPNPVPEVMREAGWRVDEAVDGEVRLQSSDVLFLMGNAHWYPLVRKQLADVPRNLRPFVAIWHTEPLPPPRKSGLPRPHLSWREWARILRRDTGATDAYTNARVIRQMTRMGLVDLVVVSSRARRDALIERGIEAHFVPVGYDRRYHGHDMMSHRDIDVLFLGALIVPRRTRVLRRLRKIGVNVVAMGDWNDPNCWGENRAQLLNRTKILLNIQRYPGELTGTRLVLGMANKALVISEPIYEPTPFVPDRHYVTATIDQMPSVIQHYLTHEDDRQQIVEEGHRFVTKERTMKRSVGVLLDLISSQRSHDARYM